MSSVQNLDEDLRYKKYVPFLNRCYNLYCLMYLTQAALFQARYREVKECGLTSMELALLTVVEGLGGSATPADISRWMMRKRPTISGLLNRMERNGLVLRTVYKENRKLRKVMVTEKGQKALTQSKKKDILNTIIASMSDNEYRQLWSLLEKLKDTALSMADGLKEEGGII
jgi:DNA-binding MarR family transcriptional regulator